MRRRGRSESDRMTDPTPERRDRELELLEHRRAVEAQLDENTLDLVAITITRPQLRQATCSALAADELCAVLNGVLVWVDELLLTRDADEIRLQLELRAQVALGVTPSGLADLDPD